MRKQSINDRSSLMRKGGYGRHHGLNRLVMLLVLIMSLTLFTACQDNSNSGKKLVVGLDDTFAPMGFRDEKGELVGFDIDLARAVGEELGVEVEFKPIKWEAKEMELNSKNIDCIWNGMSQTPEREEALSLSKKYLNNRIVLLSLKEDVDSKKVQIAADADLSNFKIATQADSSALEVLKKSPSYDDFKGNITEYESYDNTILDLQSGRVDVIAIDQVLGEFKNNNLKGILAENELDLGEDFYVIGFRKDDTDLTNKVNDSIKKLIDNGKAAEISNKWFGKDIMIFE